MSEQTAAGKALRLWVHRPVLSVNQKPVVPRAAQLLSDGGRATVEEEAHLRLTSLQLGLEDFPTLIGDRQSGVCVRSIVSCREECRCSRRISTFPARRVYSGVLLTIHVTSGRCETPSLLLSIDTVVAVDARSLCPCGSTQRRTTSSRGLR